MIQLVTDTSQLEAVAEHAKKADVIAVDTEFLREKTYRAKLCLVQLGIDDQQYCVDVLAIGDLVALVEIMQNPQILKLFHAARQDLEVILDTFNIIPEPIFDTQLAAAFCGADMQLGHSALVEDKLGVVLPKSQARTDWTRRPLTEKQIEYAADDVAYLHSLYQILNDDLEKQGKLDWYLQEMEGYCDKQQYRINPSQAYRRLSAGRLNLKQQSVLQALAQWREKRAYKRDLPRNWVLRDDKLYALVDALPTSIDQLMESKILSNKQITSYAQSIIDIINTTVVSQQAIWLREDPLNKEDKSHIKTMMNIVNEQAEQLQIAKALLATRKDIEFLYRHQTSQKLFSGWRKENIGQPLLHSLEPGNLG